MFYNYFNKSIINKELNTPNGPADGNPPGR